MVTIKDVARLAGVSPSTASRAMHDNEMISQATRDRVKKVMEELNYSPNYSAQNLVKRQSNTVGIILPVRESQEVLGDNPFFMQIIQGISGICTKEGQMVSLATGQKEKDLLKNVQNMIRSGNVRKFIFLYSKTDDPVFDYMRKEKVRCVVVGQPYDQSQKQAYFVNNHNQEAGKDATNFLLDKGYQAISYVYTDMDELVQAERYMGYAEAMKIRNHQAQSLNVSLVDHEASKKQLLQHLEQRDAQAFVTSDDMLGIHLQRLLKEIGQENKAIISFNNSVLAQLANPALTSVDIFPYLLGERAASVLLKTHQAKDAIDIIPHKIIERESTPNFLI
ncbi:LacI family DNA-binding transcriptional regulator [Streptococcus uberis]|uniref:LacI family DNA-binding transcriptional regulator n=1 Tax=Streptococcus uberis TaxID=1349 RepID=UPI0013959F9F|nr:LacI family DNA-binding transcriptional regulator [Streptococcus uberis]MTB69573.1 LacI family DNA-binding transcriptional regulator [Streptococcus uberis]